MIAAVEVTETPLVRSWWERRTPILQTIDLPANMNVAGPHTDCAVRSTLSVAMIGMAADVAAE